MYTPQAPKFWLQEKKKTKFWLQEKKKNCPNTDSKSKLRFGLPQDFKKYQKIQNTNIYQITTTMDSFDLQLSPMKEETATSHCTDDWQISSETSSSFIKSSNKTWFRNALEGANRIWDALDWFVRQWAPHGSCRDWTKCQSSPSENESD